MRGVSGNWYPYRDTPESTVHSKSCHFELLVAYLNICRLARWSFAQNCICEFGQKDGPAGLRQPAKVVRTSVMPGESVPQDLGRNFCNGGCGDYPPWDKIGTDSG